jgi:hypothetical protein
MEAFNFFSEIFKLELRLVFLAVKILLRLLGFDLKFSDLCSEIVVDRFDF